VNGLVVGDVNRQTVEPRTARAGPRDISIAAPTHERFLFTTVCSRRAHQLRAGATPRLPPASRPASVHRIAMEEVIRGYVPYWRESRSGHPSIAISTTGGRLTPDITIDGGASAVITRPDGVIAFHAACLNSPPESIHQALALGDPAPFSWNVWHEPALHPYGLVSRAVRGAPVRVEDESEFETLDVALIALHSTWLANESGSDTFVMTVTIAPPGDRRQGISLDSQRPVLIACPGSLTLTIAGALLKQPVAWVITLGLASGTAPSVQAETIRTELRTRALIKKDVEVLPEVEDVDAAKLGTSSGLVVFIHGLFSTDIGTFDAVIDRVRFLAPSALLAGFSHNTLTEIDNNALKLQRWLTKLLGFNSDDGSFKRRPAVVFVCHSRGGLVARMTAARLFESNKAWKTVVRGAVTFGTPHEGAALAEVPNEMAAAVAVLAVVDGTRTAVGLREILAYAASGGLFEGIEDLRPIEGAGTSRDRFLKKLVDKETSAGRLNILAFGGDAPKDSVVARIVGRALGGVQHDHVVERSSSIPKLFDTGSLVRTESNHFGYFAATEENAGHLNRAARQVAAWLAG
jgi:pimeloyl-ACP methyl ester carboxylesterase/DNA-directed RNA polymerase subunit K/omega